ncbi:MAG: hypothetical protein Kow0077_07220 [Anaerolineae bacterium]
MAAVHQILNNAYILFSFLLGGWCILKLIRNETLDGQFWGAVAANTILALSILLWTVVMVLTGIRPHRMVTYFLYALYFVVVLPGTFSLLRGRDDRLAVIIFGIVTIFSAAAATRVPLLVQPWVAGP